MEALERRDNFMSERSTRRDFLASSGSLIGAGLLVSSASRPGKAGATKGPHDFVIVEGHRDIWELSGRIRLPEKEQHSPITNFLTPRLIEAGLSVVIMPASGDSLEERDGLQGMFEGAMRVLDMILTDIDKSGGKASIIRTKADVPTKPNVGKVQYFLDIEGGGAIQTDLPEPGFSRERDMALLRQFFASTCAVCS
jgi:hypothetical protein